MAVASQGGACQRATAWKPPLKICFGFRAPCFGFFATGRWRALPRCAANAARTEPNQHQNHCGGPPGRLGDDESDGVREVVEVDGLPVAVDVRRDDSEAVEVSAGFLVAGLQKHRSGLAIEHD